MSLKILLSRNLIFAVVYLAALNVFVALIFYSMRAPDLAVTQASVNAALVTIIFVYAIKRCGL
jgi:uncharacterized MnhB-related membrane protein